MISFKNYCLKKFMKKTFILVCYISFLSSCSLPFPSAKKEASSKSDTSLVDLVDSTRIIRLLIAKDKIGETLEPHDSSQLELLLNNKSPAQMVFESEVLSTTIPLVVVYYFKAGTESKKFIDELKVLADKYDDKIKFVVIDVDQLFSLAVDAEIEKVPTILFVENRNIIERIEEIPSIDQLNKKLINYTQKK